MLVSAEDSFAVELRVEQLSAATLPGFSSSSASSLLLPPIRSPVSPTSWDGEEIKVSYQLFMIAGFPSQILPSSSRKSKSARIHLKDLLHASAE